MIQLIINEGNVTPYERHVLSLSQIIVLAALRQLRTRKRVADFLGREERCIEMVTLRIRKKGIVL